MLAEFPEAGRKVSAALAARTLSLVDGLDAARLRALDADLPGPGAHEPRAPT